MNREEKKVFYDDLKDLTHDLEAIWHRIQTEDLQGYDGAMWQSLMWTVCESLEGLYIACDQLEQLDNDAG